MHPFEDFGVGIEANHVPLDLSLEQPPAQAERSEMKAQSDAVLRPRLA